MKIRHLLAALLLTTSVANHASAQETSDSQPLQSFPLDLKTSVGQVALYQPQLDFWNGAQLEARSAVAIQAEGAASPTFGVITYKANTQVDKGRRLVVLEDFTITQSSFPSASADASAYANAISAALEPMQKTIELDRLEAQLKILQAKGVANSVPVENPAPSILLSEVPSILVQISGDPKWVEVGQGYSRVLNTTVLLLKDSNNQHFLHLFDGWMTAQSLTGTWTVVESTPEALGTLKQQIVNQVPSIDLLTGKIPDAPASGSNDGASSAGGSSVSTPASTPAPVPPSLSNKPAPQVIISTKPAELIVFAGPPQWVPIEGTNLLFASNTTGNFLVDEAGSRFFVLVTGRWFTATASNGPWTYTPGKSLPADFAKIPDSSPKENVKASVPGTSQAQEALIANSIPQTATVKISELQVVAPTTDGPPELSPIQGTTLSYVVNASDPIIQTAPNQFYMVQNAIWFSANTPEGPWAVATSVPTAIYTIPASSPLHYVTYVQIYGGDDATVKVGYTPGYYGTVISDDVVVFGTGYPYTPWIGTVYYPVPVTYGLAANITYTPWTGWAYGFGLGWAWGSATWGYGWGVYPAWGPYAWYPRGGAYIGPRGGAAVWGPGGWAGATGNVYRRYGNTGVVSNWSGGYDAWTGTGWRSERGMSYNSVTGRVSAGQRGVIANGYSGNYAAGEHGSTYNPNTGRSVSAGRGTVGNVDTGRSVEGSYVHGSDGTIAKANGNLYASHDGNVYRKSDDGTWQGHDNDNWNDVSHDQINSTRTTDVSAEDRAGFQRNYSADNFSSLNSDWASREQSFQSANRFQDAGGFGGFSNRDSGSLRGGFGGGGRRR